MRRLISSLSRDCQPFGPLPDAGPPAKPGAGWACADAPAVASPPAASASITTESTGLGTAGWGSGCTAVTLPAMLACTGADTKDLESPIF
jgi:hypothetical protein